MTLVLGAIAAFLFLAIVAAVVHESRSDDVLGTAPTSGLQSTSGSISIAPTYVAPQTFDDVLASKEEAAAQTKRSVASLDQFLPGNLGVGTTLTHEGRVSTIVGVFRFDFDGELWQDYLVEDRGGEWWRFGVEPDRGFRLAAFQPHPIPIEPGPSMITFQGASYSVTESGKAHFRAAGRTGTFDKGKYWYFDYENADGTILSFERFDHDNWKTSIGHRVDPHSVVVDNEIAEPLSTPTHRAPLTPTVQSEPQVVELQRATILPTHARRGR